MNKLTVEPNGEGKCVICGVESKDLWRHTKKEHPKSMPDPEVVDSIEYQLKQAPRGYAVWSPVWSPETLRMFDDVLIPTEPPLNAGWTTTTLEGVHAHPEEGVLSAPLQPIQNGAVNDFIVSNDQAVETLREHMRATERIVNFHLNELGIPTPPPTPF